MSTVSIIAGLDIGNGYVKGQAKGLSGRPTNIDLPSGVAIVRSTNDLKVKPEEIQATMDDIYNRMEASFSSPMISKPDRRLFGHRGLESGKGLDEFDVNSTASKAVDELSPVLVLGTLAGKALQDVWERDHEIPKDIVKVNARLGLALPIQEFMDYRGEYANRFLQADHMVTIHNFEQIVRVSIHVEDVQVLAEGESAQYAISMMGEPLMEAMLQDARNHGDMLPGITAKDVLAAKNTLSIDIGEGTVNFPVFRNGKFNTDVSTTYKRGYGNVLTNVLERARKAGVPFNSRKALADFLQTEPSPMVKGRYDKVQNIVNEEIEDFAEEVVQEFTKIMARVGSYIEVVYVYGGGASHVKPALHDRLIEESKNFGGEDVSYPVLYLDSRYSRSLNRNGLYLVCDTYAKSVRAKAPAVPAE